MTISGGRTEQLDIFCHVTGFMSDFLSFVELVEYIWFFHGALQLLPCVYIHHLHQQLPSHKLQLLDKLISAVTSY